MVCYCCVEGCKNNSNIKKKDPNSVLSFHAFPTNQEQKTKWLKAIGRPNWTPGNHVRICSAHFNYEQINYDGCRIRIKDDAVPVNFLPLNSNFEASNVEACRICLATDTELYSLQDPQLRACMESIAGAYQNGMCLEGLPQYVCYQCAPILVKSHRLIEKCMLSQTTLLDIFVKNGQITKSLIEERSKSTDSLSASASSEELNNYLVRCEDINLSPFPPNSCDVYFKSEDNTHIDSRSYTVRDTDCKVELDEEFENYDLEEKMSSVDSTENRKVVINVDVNEKLKSKKCTKKERMTKLIKGLTPDENSMLKYFHIIQLSLPEQIVEWQKSVTRRTLTSETVYQCKICNKMFANSNSYQLHINYHDPTLGPDECPVCKLRFRSATLVAAHRKRAHSKKFFCKMCPKSFNNVNVAKKHSRWHSGYRYQCGRCTFSSAHESALCAHSRRAHPAPHGCAHCGRHYATARGLNAHVHAAHTYANDKVTSKEYHCDQCDINFASESAKRVHLLTSSLHKKKPTNLCDPTMDPILRNCCNKCGVECSTFKDLLVHMREAHPRPRRADQTWKGNTGYSYPLDCELCGEKIASRKKHWYHVRRRHPKHIDSYHPIITVICDMCGKGFQNSTKLRIHQLRHSSPKVRCAHCPRLFYDKYALNRHAQTHNAEKPHQCRICGRAFKLLSNLERHARVHTDVAPYECTICNKKFKYSSSVNLHVRTVHYKLPHPTRKKRSKPAKDVGDS